MMATNWMLMISGWARTQLGRRPASLGLHRMSGVQLVGPLGAIGRNPLGSHPGVGSDISGVRLGDGALHQRQQILAAEMYRNRLIRAYLGASNGCRDGNQFTGFAQSDNIQMRQLDPTSSRSTWSTLR